MTPAACGPESARAKRLIFGRMSFEELWSLVPGRESLLGQALRYLVTGGLAFVLDFGLFFACYHLLEWHYLVANLIGLLAGLTLNYLMSTGWVFSACERNLGRHKFGEILVFSVIGFLGVGLNQLLMFVMVDELGFYASPSKLVAAAVVLVWNFGARKASLFRKVRSLE